MTCVAVPLLALAVLGADENLPAPTRLESGGQVIGLAAGLVPGGTFSVTPDGNTLFAVVEEGDRYDLVAWDIPSRSKNVLAKGPHLPYLLSLSPDGRSLLSCVAVARGRGEDVWHADADFVVWNVADKSRTALARQKDGVALASHEFSLDGTLLSIADPHAKTVHLWKRDAAGKWTVFRALDVAQGKDALQYGLRTTFSPDGKELFVLFVTLREREARVPAASLDRPEITVEKEIYAATCLEKWDVATGRRIPFPAAPVEVDCPGLFITRLITDGRTLCTDCLPRDTKGGAFGFDATSGRMKYALPWPLLAASLSPDRRTGAAGRRLLMGATPAKPTRVNFWSFPDGRLPREVELPGSDEWPSATFTADSRFFVCTGEADSSRIYVIDVETAKVRTSFKMAAPIKGVFPLATGEIAAVGVEPKAILIWRIKAP